MRLRRSFWAISLASALGVFAWAAPASAQERHVVDRPALQAAITTKVNTDTANRAAVLAAVHQPEAVTMAARLGLTPTEVDDAVATMSPADLATLVGPARMAADAPRAGGDISISVTVLLLLLILLVLIVK